MKPMCRKIVFLLCLFFSLTACSQESNTARLVIGQNTGWQFAKDAEGVFQSGESKQLNWTSIDIPHTWNVTDIMDDTPGYYRGAAYYKKQLHCLLPAAAKKYFSVLME